MSGFPMLRVRAISRAPLRPERRYVLYWMIACRRAHDSFALDRCVTWARELDRPVVVLEALRCGHRHASERLHRFVLDGMIDNAAAFERAGVTYLPYVERAPGEGRGLLRALAEHACVVVTDEYPTFFLPRMVDAAAGQLSVRLEAVDGNGLLPLRAARRAFPRAYGFRRFLQRELPHHIDDAPSRDPFAALERAPRPRLPSLRAWPMTSARQLGRPSLVAELPIDHEVGAVALRGGSGAGLSRALEFIRDELARYPEERAHPDSGVESRLSPYLHFGHLSTHRVLAELASSEGWRADRLPREVTGKREGAWGMSPGAEAFLDQLVTWRELGYVFCAYEPAHASYDALPPWARATLKKHAADPRLALYSREDLEQARTGDELWNAAQRQLVVEGRIHNSLRMLWGKRVLEWTRTPEEAHALLFELNDRWALDGRDPNSVSGIGWTLGLFDRAWGPERPIFGTVRYMSSAAQRRKLRMKQWLARFSVPPS
jgi:deoxyribodipyrimidine photo-lyase